MDIMQTQKTRIIQKTFQYRLKTTADQYQKCMQFAGARRFVYNYGLDLVRKAFDIKEKIPSYTDIANLLPILKKSENTEWLKEIHSQALQQTLKDRELSLKHFFGGLKTKQKIGFPIFKKKGKNDSFRYPQGVKTDEDKIWLPKIGWVKYLNSRPLDGIIKQTTIKRQAKHWYVSISCEIETSVIKASASTEKTVGIGVGIADFAYISDGIKIENPSFLKKELHSLSHLQCSLSRKKRGSNNRKKAIIKVVKKHIDIYNQRKNFAHQLSNTLVKNHDVIVVEDLNIKGMMQNKHLARSIADASWGIFFSLLKYKCDWYGKHFITIDRFYPSSKMCFSCGNKQEIGLSERVYHCLFCGMCIDRDWTASLNIRAAGLVVLNACGGSEVALSDKAGIPGF
jgi:putative transposase